MFNEKPASITSTIPTPQHLAALNHPQLLSELTDQQLLDQCHHYGSQAKLWRQKFLGLLPEVDKRSLYLKQSCSSIFEFAAKFGGVSREQVLVVMRTSEKLEAMPLLKQALFSGQVSVNKLVRVVSVATPENQDFWLNQSQLLSSRALETLVKDSKPMHVHASSSNKTEKITKVPQSDELQLSSEITRRLLSLLNKGLDLNQILGELLDQREERIEQEKQNIVNELNEEGQETTTKSATMIQPKSRYIPKKIRNVVKSEYGEKCAHSNCSNKSVNTHHQQRFSLDPRHNPVYLVPLCKQHHEIAHTIDVKVVERRRGY